MITRQRCCPMARCWSRGAISAALYCQRGAVRSGDRDVDDDRLAERSAPVTRRRCCPMERCWLPGARAGGNGPFQRGAVRSGQRGVDDDRLADQPRLGHTATLLPNGQGAGRAGDGRGPRSCTIRPPGVDGDRLAEHRALITRRRCCPMGRCWSRGAVAASSAICPARSCTIRPAGRGRRPAR